MPFLTCMGCSPLSRASVKAKLNLQCQRIIISMDISGEFIQKFKIPQGIPSGRDENAVLGIFNLDG